MRESDYLINQEKQPGRISKSFLILLIASGLLLAAATATLAVLYIGALQSIRENRIYKILPGDAVLVNSQFVQLNNTRVGLITNPTAVVDSIHIIDWMFFTPNNVNMSLVALFGPEHGLRGDNPAGAPIGNYIDERTGLPVYSLYGNYTAPSSEMLEGINALVFDIQDIGCRFYTYISTMGLCMQAAAAAGIPFFVLDRPNPIGSAVSGWILSPEYASFIGQYAIPLQYGLTSGELALMIQGEALLPGLDNLTLTVVQMDGYSDGLFWADTNLPWISPSPNMVDLDTAILYPGTGFFEAFNWSTEGRGTLTPFKKIGAPWITNATQEILINNLNQFNLPGVLFSPTQFIPVNIYDMSGPPKFENQTVMGIEIQVTDRYSVAPVELGVYLVYSFYQLCPNDTKSFLIDQDNLALHAGTTHLYEALQAQTPPNQIIWEWKTSVQEYLQTRNNYLLY